jgi:broad specificity phosphatase PhoE
MGRLFLVRHGQASFGSDDYDRLSELGARQCRRLGEHWRARGLGFEATFTGTLRRHRQSFDALAEGIGGLAEPTALPGMNEYDAEAIVRAIHPQPLPHPATPELVRQHFRLLKEGLLQWMDGRIAPEGMPNWHDFVGGVVDALDRVRTQHRGDVLMVSSGGPISAAVAQVLKTAPEAVVELNLRMRNSAVTEFAYTPKRHALVTFNTLPHLEADGYADWVTHS